MLHKLLSFFVSLATMFFGITLVAFAADPAHYWALDEGIGREVRDEVAGENGEIIGSGAGFGWASGKVGVGLAMSGAQGQGIVLPEGFLSGGVGSVSVWFRLNSYTDRNVLFSGKSVTENSVYMAILVDQDGRPMIQMRDAATNPDRRTQAMTILNRNEWYHLVVTADAQRYHFYVNGVEHEVAGDAIPRWFPELTNQRLAYRIGFLDSSVLSGSFDGTIDDVRIYSSVLTPSEVSALFAKTNEMSPTVPVGHRPSITLSADPLVLPAAGSSTLTWKATNVTTCTKGGAWQGNAPVSGSETVNVTANSTYTLDCSGAGGIANASVTLEIGKSQGAGSIAVGGNGIEAQTIVLSTPMTEAQRQEKIAELRAKIQELMKKLAEIIAAMQKAQ